MASTINLDASPIIDLERLRALSRAVDPDPETSFDEEEPLRVLAARELLLLRQTLEYARVHVPYYQALFERERFDVLSLERLKDLTALPVLKKATVAADVEAFVSRAPGLRVTSVVSTSGTTSNHRLPRVISEEELEACSLLASITTPRHAPNAAGDILLRLLPTMRRYVGPGRGTDVPQVVVTLSLHYPKYALHRSNYEDFVLKQFFEKFPIPGTAGYVTLVHATPPYLMRIVSEEMAARGLSPRDTHVRSVACSGGPVTNRLLTLIGDVWQVPLVTSYSLTELNGYALGCDVHPNRYHFDASVYAEVVDPVDRASVAEGEEGVLLLTSLYPFQQAQLFIRYDTGDLVRFVGRTCECGHIGTGIEYLGRVDHCLDLAEVVPDHGGRRFLASTHIHDVLEDMREIPSLLYPRFEVRCVDEGGRVKLQLITEVYQISTAAMLADVERRIRSGIFSRYPALERHVEQGTVGWETRICNRGEMDSYYRLYPDS